MRGTAIVYVLSIRACTVHTPETRKCNIIILLLQRERSSSQTCSRGGRAGLVAPVFSLFIHPPSGSGRSRARGSATRTTTDGTRARARDSMTSVGGGESVCVCLLLCASVLSPLPPPTGTNANKRTCTSARQPPATSLPSQGTLVLRGRYYHNAPTRFSRRRPSNNNNLWYTCSRTHTYKRTIELLLYYAPRARTYVCMCACVWGVFVVGCDQHLYDDVDTLWIHFTVVVIVRYFQLIFPSRQTEGRFKDKSEKDNSRLRL